MIPLTKPIAPNPSVKTNKELSMIECKECGDYVEGLFNRGEIVKEEIEKVKLDRHILKGCDKRSQSFKEWLDFAILNQQQIDKENVFTMPHWNKGYMEALLDCKEHYLSTLTNEGTK